MTISRSSVLVIALLFVMMLPPANSWSAPAASTGTAQTNSPAVIPQASGSVLLSFPNCTYFWFSGDTGRFSTAFNLTLAATQYYGLSLNYSTSSLYGPYVNEIGGYWNSNSSTSFTGPYWLLWVWNASLSSWVISNLGAGDVAMANVTAVAWSYSMLNAQTGEPYSAPQQTPLDMFAVPSLRGAPDGTAYNPDFTNIAAPSPSSHLSWSASAGGSVDVQPVDSNGLSYYVTDGSNGTSDVLAYNYYGMLSWRTQIGSRGFELASPLAVNGMLIVPSTDGNIYALNATNGMSLYTVRGVSSSPDGLTGSPVLGPEGYFVLNESGGLDYFALNGTLLWTAALGGGGYYVTPSYSNNTVFAFSGAGNDSILSVVNSTSGRIEAGIPVNGSVFGEPSVSRGRIVFVSSLRLQTGGGYNVTVHCLELGLYKWLWNYSAGLSGAAPSSTVLTGGRVIFSSGGSVVELNSSDGQPIWRMKVNNQFSSPSPYSAAGYIFSSTNSNTSSLSVTTLGGSLIWNYTAPWPNDYSLSSPAFNGTTVFWADDSGHIYSFQRLDIVNFSYTQSLGTVNLTSAIDRHVTGAVNCTWSVNGTTAYGSNVSIAFGHNGNYTVTVTVKYSAGTEASYTSVITVDTVSQGNSSGNGAGGAGLTITAVVEYLVIPAIVLAAAVTLALRRRRKVGGK